MIVDIAGGEPPLRLAIYVDGDDVDGVTLESPRCAARSIALAGGRAHAVTARVIDADGRWGAASVVVRPPEGRSRSAAPRGAASR